VIWLLVTAQDGSTKKYYKIIVTVQAQAQIEWMDEDNDYVIGTQDDLILHITGEDVVYTGTERVYLDGNQLNSTQYRTESGSIKVILYSNYLATLYPGSHTIRVEYVGGSVNTLLGITAQNNDVPNGAPTTYILTASAGAGGSVSPSRIVATQGESYTVTITPDAGYAITDVSVDGVSVGKVSSYTFNNIVSAHSLTATFARVTKSPATGTPLNMLWLPGILLIVALGIIRLVMWRKYKEEW
jgi:hypothetical protein